MGVDVLYICGGRSFYSQALGRKIHSVVESWREHHFTVDLICGGDILSKNNVDKITYGASKHHSRLASKIGILAFFKNSLSELRDIVHDSLILKKIRCGYNIDKPKIIWERSSRLHKSGLSLAKEINIPYVLEWKDNLVPYKFSIFKLLALKVERQKVLEADYIVVESTVLKNHLLRQYPILENKIIVAHNAVNSQEFVRDEVRGEEIRRSVEVLRSQILIGYVGSYAFYHDTERLVLAASILKDKGYKFLFVGAGKNFNLVYKTAEKLNLINNSVYFLPPVPKEDVPSILSALDIAVLPGSTDIICPIKIQEFMAMELPTILPDYSCNREVIDEMRTGLFFKPYDERSLAKNIMTIAEDEALRVKIGDNARKEVVKRFSWSSTWVAALKKILSSY